jgi:hypothetical protein
MQIRELKIQGYCLAVSVLFFLLLSSGCTTTPPEGTPIDFESTRNFKPFTLNDLEGNQRELSEFLSEATLVAFFFPT